MALRPVWSQSGNQHNRWYRGNVPFVWEKSDDFQVGLSIYIAIFLKSVAYFKVCSRPFADKHLQLRRYTGIVVNE